MTRRPKGRKQAEEIREADYRALVEESPALTYVQKLGEPGLTRYLSLRTEEMLGYSPGELVGEARRWEEVLHPDDRERVVAEATRAISADEPFEMEYLCLARDERVVWVRDEALVVRDEEGRPRFWRGVLFDITGRKRVEEALEESRARFRAMFENAGIGMALIDMEGWLEESNSALREMLGYGDEELRGTGFTELTHPEDVPADEELYEELVAGKRDRYQTEKRYVKKDGGLVWGCLTVSLVRDAGGEPQFAIGMVEDITKRKQAEEALRRSGLVAAQRIAHVGNWEYSIERDEAYWSDEMYRIFGLAPRELVPTYKTFLRSVHPDDRDLIRKMMRKALYAGEHPSLDYRVVRPDGEVRNVRTRYEVLYDEAGEPETLVGTVHDITEHKALEERLTYQAFHDSLTGLPNRALFLDRLEQALARMQRRRTSIAVLFVDLDNFKFANDSLGHEVGDKLLVAVAGRLRGCIRPEDTLGRLGGDEFTVLLEEIEGASDAVQVAERIMQALRAPFEFGGHRLLTSASIGIVVGATPRERPGDLLRNADLAMYEAKNKGKARYEVFDSGISVRLARRSQLEDDLRRALELDEFVVLYQPKMRLETGEITGMEALLRWERPGHGLLPPSEFIQVAEKTGLLIQIGYKVLEDACRQMRLWQERHPRASPRTVYINLSARQFNDPGLIEAVTRTTRETGVEPGNLALEIVESVLMSDVQSAVVKLRALSELGARIVVDDFGASYSSLSQLGRFPMSFLNIDRSLTFRLGIEPEDTAIVSAMINLAHALGWEVTAEGVENADQLARLRELGCDMAQGYHLWEPLTSEEASASLVASHH